jgi:hypothetical protein
MASVLTLSLELGGEGTSPLTINRPQGGGGGGIFWVIDSFALI